MRTNYQFAEVVAHTGIDRRRLDRWAEIGLIETSGGGSQGKRRAFSLWAIVEVAVLNHLRGLGVAEPGLWAIAPRLHQFFAEGLPRDRYAVVLWLGYGQYTTPPDPTVHESVMCWFTDLDRLVEKLREQSSDGPVHESGTVVLLGRMIAAIERSTGDTLDAVPDRHRTWREIERASIASLMRAQVEDLGVRISDEKLAALVDHALALVESHATGRVDESSTTPEDAAKELATKG